QHAADCIVRYIEAFINHRYSLLLQRLEDRRIVEGHGDLRPEHIRLGSAPRIDCLEFRPDLRYLDPVDEPCFWQWNASGWAAAASEQRYSIIIAGAPAMPAAGADRILPGDRRLDPRPHRDPAPPGEDGIRPAETAEASGRIA